MKSMTVYKDVDLMIWRKMWHIHKEKGTIHCDFTKVEGELPIGSFNVITKKWEPCVNHRGVAYALRNAKRNKKKVKD